LALIGTTLDGAYRITRLIAEGGMSAVYEAVQLRLNQRVAVKVMARELASNQEALARFRREADITSRLRHPHLVTVSDFGTAPEGQPYLVMEYLEGIDLEHRIRQVGQLPLPTVVHIAQQVSSALGAAHDQGIVHRDLKPANVFLVELTGEPDFAKVLDFGISKVRAANTQLTKASSIIGTPNYMSPEQATGMLDEIDHRTDQWALACIVWEMLAGRPPFAADDMSAVFYQVIHLDPQPLGKHRPDLPPAVEAVLRRALSKSMAERFPSLRDFATALAGAASGQSAAEAGVEGTASVERRRVRQDRRRAVRVDHALSKSEPTGDRDIQAMLAASSRRRPNLIYLVPVLAGALLAAGSLMWLRSRPASVLAPQLPAPAVVPVPAAATPALVPQRSIPATPEPAAAVAKPTARPVKHRLQDAPTGPSEYADPFELPRRSVQGRKAGTVQSAKDRRDDGTFVDPFAP
jgi:tRNA A-37 threonylcarbamoyl transferase component Bud32